MKLITAIIQPMRLNAVREALITVDTSGITVSEVKGFGRQKGQPEMYQKPAMFYRGTARKIDFLSKIKLEIAVTDDKVKETIKAITDAASTNDIGAGKIFVTDLEEVIRIRTGETGEQAL